MQVESCCCSTNLLENNNGIVATLVLLSFQLDCYKHIATYVYIDCEIAKGTEGIESQQYSTPAIPIPLM